ncbi:MAG: hypothetical protein KA765_06565 [Thermoflexales bacterium]|nr:hypothetical protein [Thermoflexales bacterium]
MKIIFRTVIILVAALVVVGIASALNSTGAFGNLNLIGREGFEGGRPFGREFNGQLPTSSDGTRPNFEQGGFQRGRGEGDREGRGGASAFGLSEVLKSLVMMTVVIVVIVPASKLLKRVGWRGSPPRAASNQQS